MDYNKKDEQYIAYAFGAQAHYGVLRPEAQQTLGEYQRLVTAQFQKSSANFLANDLSKLLSRAQSVLFYSSKIARIIADIERLPAIPPEVAARIPKEDLIPPVMIVSPQRELGMEFESLMLHALAGLDTLANVVAAHCVDSKRYNKKGKEIQAYFSDLKISLGKSRDKDHRSGSLYRMFCDCEPTLQHIVLPANGKKTLRNHIAHEATTCQPSESSFLIHWLSDGRVLRLDSEVYGVPLIETARNLTWTAAYMLISAVGIFLRELENPAAVLHGTVGVCQPASFEPTWNHNMVSWKKYLSADPSHPIISVVRANEAGFSIDNVRLKPEILDRAVPFGLALA